MVELNFKLSEVGTLTFELEEVMTLGRLMEVCAAQTGKECGGCIAVRNGKVLRDNETVFDTDTIDILPAISGG